MRVERIELSSQVWKTCILTTVLYPQDKLYLGWDIGFEPFAKLRFERKAHVLGVGYRVRTDDLLDHNQTL